MEFLPAMKICQFSDIGVSSCLDDSDGLGPGPESGPSH